jgi:hypothetical protein
MDMKKHAAELLLDIRLHPKLDKLRKTKRFNTDLQSAHAILLNPENTRPQKINAYRAWLTKSQPCIFGRLAATQKRVFVCLLEENEILGMRKGDDDLRDTIQDYRQLWKRYALEGRSSSFVLAVTGESLVNETPGERLKEFCRRLLEVYMEVPNIADDTIVPQREYVFLKLAGVGNEEKILKFATLPNVFCAQGDGRWWHDHRCPGGVMITSNALGHDVYSRNGRMPIDDAKKIEALEQAMRTINNAYKEKPSKRAGALKHCPATFLVAKGAESCPVLKKDVAAYSADHYEGYFHTDHLLPSVFFQEERDPKDLPLYQDLSLKYIFDGTSDPLDHADLMQGSDASWYDVKRNLDRLPRFSDPETIAALTPKMEGQLKQWAAKRLKERM